jgi:hypothetical protein
MCTPNCLCEYCTLHKMYCHPELIISLPFNNIQQTVQGHPWTHLFTKSNYYI